MNWHKKVYTFYRNVRNGPPWSVIGPIDLNGNDWNNSTSTLTASLKATGEYEEVTINEGVVFARTAVTEKDTYTLTTFMKADK